MKRAARVVQLVAIALAQACGSTETTAGADASADAAADVMVGSDAAADAPGDRAPDAPDAPAAAVRVDAGEACPSRYVLVAPGVCRLECAVLNTQDVCPTGSTCKSFVGGKYTACGDPI